MVVFLVRMGLPGRIVHSRNISVHWRTAALLPTRRPRAKPSAAFLDRAPGRPSSGSGETALARSRKVGIRPAIPGALASWLLLAEWLEAEWI